MHKVLIALIVLCFASAAVLVVIKSLSDRSGFVEKTPSTENQISVAKGDHSGDILGETVISTKLSILNDLTPDQIILLKRELTGNPYWFVTQEGKIVSAYLREKTPDGIRLGFNQYRRSEIGSSQLKLVFAETYQPRPEWNVQEVDASVPKNKVLVRNGNGNPRTYETWILIKGRSPLYVMVYDSNDTSADRSQTQDLLNLFKKEVIETMIQKRVVELTGAKEKSLLPVSDTIQGLKIGCLFTRCRTSFAVSATFNPGGTGYAALKAFKDSDGKPIAIVPDDTKQIMGWSQNSSQMFLYNSNIDLGVEDGATSVRLELWFHPDNSGEPRLITSHVMTVDTKICDGEICE